VQYNSVCSLDAITTVSLSHYPHLIEADLHFRQTVLSFLAVDPSAQRTGAGTALVKWGTERADADGLPIFVSASLVAAPLYKRLGWETKDLGTVRYPITGMEVLMTHMVREPRPSTHDA
jgi:predicted N-acetyltransferase YhbS